jgi:hypothetical protein
VPLELRRRTPANYHGPAVGMGREAADRFAALLES